MNLLGTLLASAQGGNLGNVGQQFGLDPSSTQNVLGQLLPALSRGLQQNAASPEGQQALASALANGNHQRYLDDATALANPKAVNEGNAILGHILGSKDASRNVASQAAAQTGIDAGIIKKMLPMVAAAAMGALSKGTNQGSALQGAGGQASGLLGGFLDQDGDGSVMDDVAKLARKLF